MVITPMVHLANDHPITWQPMEQQPACWLQHVLHLAIWRRFGDCGLEKNRGRSWKCFTYGATATNSGRSAPMAWFPSVGLHQTWPGDLVPALLPINFMKCRPPVTRCGKLGTCFFSRHTACNRMSSMTNTRNLSYSKLSKSVSVRIIIILVQNLDAKSTSRCGIQMIVVQPATDHQEPTLSVKIVRLSTSHR